MISETDARHLRHCIELARQAAQVGDGAFGSVLVDATGQVLKEDRNRTVTNSDVTLHPEFTLVKWAQDNLSPTERATSTVYTSGEHCPMCAAAHAYAGLGRIIYASSSEQLVQWKTESGVSLGPVAPLPINQVAPGILVGGPAPGLDEEIRELHRLGWSRKAA